MNVILVFADQMRGQDMACAGNEQVHTPNLDQMASQGVMMQRAYTNCPVCTPARGSLLTGCYPLRHGAFLNDLPIRTDLPAMGTIFKQAGYATGYVGKWHLDGVPRAKFTPPGPRRLGFDFWAVHNCTHAYMKSFYYADTPEPIHINGYEPEHQTDLAISFIQANRHKPFCLVLSWGTPHNPYDTAPQRFKDLYPAEGIRLRPNVPEERAEVARKEISGYYSHITALDEFLGRIRRTLDALGIADETLLVFTSDHGDMLHSNGRTRKQQPYEESISIPMIFHKPGLVPAGAARSELIGLTDTLPTILGLADMPLPRQMQGKDLSAMVKGNSAGLREVLLGDFCPVDEGIRIGVVEWRGLRTDRYTYARDINGPWVLYDNQADPCQARNLINDPACGPLRDELERRLLANLGEMEDEFLPWEQLVRQKQVVELWNLRERELHKDKGKFLQ